jgi:hypothetical protein
MTTPIAVLAGLILGVGAATAEAAATPREKLQKQVAKVAPPSGAKPKVLCACSFDNSPGFQNRVGFVRQTVSNNQVVVVCAGSSFDAAGELTGVSFSCQNFYLLTK